MQRIEQWIAGVLLISAVAWRTVYAYWTPLVNRYLAPPGDDSIFHTAKIADFLEGKWQLFESGYPLGFHAIAAMIGKLAHWDALTTARLVGPALLVLPIPIIFWVGWRMFKRPLPGAIAAFVWAIFAFGPLFTFGDGGYPNLLAASSILPIAVLALFRLTEYPTKKRLGILFLVLALIAMVHHLTLVYFAFAMLPFALWQGFCLFLSRKRHRHAVSYLIGALVALLLLATIFWPIYGRMFVLPIIQSLKATGDLTAFFGTGPGTRAPWDVFLLWQNGPFFITGIFCWLVLIFSRLDQRVKIILSSWLLALLVAGETPFFVFSERFLRELAIPLALSIGWAVTIVTDWFKGYQKILIPVALFALAGFFWYGRVGEIFGFPVPFEYIMRVTHDEEIAVKELARRVSEDGVILANTGNYFLPFMVPQTVEIVRDPSQLQQIALSDIDALYLAARPPLTENGPAHFQQIGQINDALKELPDFELAKKFSNGTELYLSKEK